MLAYILAIRKWDNNGITNLKSGQERLQTAAGIINRCGTASTTQLLLNVSANRIQFFLVGNELNEKNCWLKIR